MNTLYMNMQSKQLGKRTSISFMVPTHIPQKPLRVIWALHGMTSDNVSWPLDSVIGNWVDTNDVMVIMPNSDLSFYVDMAYGGNYYSFLTEELPGYISRLFPISSEREDHVIIGNSMGGYGAFEIAMRRPDLFRTAVSLSGPMRIDWIHRILSDENLAKVADFGDTTAVLTASKSFSSLHGIPLVLVQNLMECAGDITRRTFLAMYGHNVDQLSGSEVDIFHLADKLAKKGKTIRLIARCGMEDYHYESNLLFEKYAKALGLDYHLKTGPGSHNWEYWNHAIEEILPDLFIE